MPVGSIDQPNIDHCLGEMSPVEAGCLPDTNSQGTLDDTLVNGEPCQTSLSADGEYSIEVVTVGQVVLQNHQFVFLVYVLKRLAWCWRSG